MFCVVAELPHQGHERVARACETLIDARAIQQLQPGRTRNRLGRLLGDDAELGLCLGQRGLHIQPSLPAVL